MEELLILSADGCINTMASLLMAWLESKKISK